MSGMWKRSHGGTIEAPPDERGGNRYVLPNATAPHLDSTLDEFPKWTLISRSCPTSIDDHARRTHPSERRGCCGRRAPARFISVRNTPVCLPLRAGIARLTQALLDSRSGYTKAFLT